MPGIDFFDVDHTITRHSSGARFIALAIKKGVLPVRLLFIVPYYSLTYKLGMFRLRKYENGFPYLKGVKRGILEDIAKQSFEEKLREDVFPGAASLIGERRKAGRKIALATSSIDIIVKPLADYLGVTQVIATSLDFLDGVCTGRVSGGLPLFRMEKRRQVQDFADASGVKLKECSFYSDSIYDLPLLQEVGNPVAVNPDFRLRRVARRKGWPVLNFR
jgi:HAD superfamily hydrolase (TIGR01490 family)